MLFRMILDSDLKDIINTITGFSSCVGYSRVAGGLLQELGSTILKLLNYPAIFNLIRLIAEFCRPMLTIGSLIIYIGIPTFLRKNRLIFINQIKKFSLFNRHFQPFIPSL
jgi:hypothetical protein